MSETSSSENTNGEEQKAPQSASDGGWLSGITAGGWVSLSFILCCIQIGRSIGETHWGETGGYWLGAGIGGGISCVICLVGWSLYRRVLFTFGQFLGAAFGIPLIAATAALGQYLIGSEVGGWLGVVVGTAIFVACARCFPIQQVSQ